MHYIFIIGALWLHNKYIIVALFITISSLCSLLYHFQFHCVTAAYLTAMLPSGDVSAIWTILRVKIKQIDLYKLLTCMNLTIGILHCKTVWP